MVVHWRDLGEFFRLVWGYGGVGVWLVGEKWGDIFGLDFEGHLEELGVPP